MSREIISDDDLAPPENLSPKEQIFKRYDSRRSFPDRNQHQIAARPQTPVIHRKITVSSVPPPTTAEGFLHRKQEIQSGGKRSTVRAWKSYYTVLCGQLLCFFKDKKSFLEKSTSKPPINILGARCTLPKDYRKKKFVFRLEPTDGSSFLFEAENDIKRKDWIQKINYTASLPPSMQLMSAADERDTVVSPRKDTIGSEKDDHDTWTAFKEKGERADSQVKKDDYRYSFTEDEIYDDIAMSIDTIQAVSNPIYDTPGVDNERSDTLTSYDEALHSARSSLSNQSYRTGK